MVSLPEQANSIKVHASVRDKIMDGEAKKELFDKKKKKFSQSRLISSRSSISRLDPTKIKVPWALWSF